jgi:hypothetical protein
MAGHDLGHQIAGCGTQRVPGPASRRHPGTGIAAPQVARSGSPAGCRPARRAFGQNSRRPLRLAREALPRAQPERARVLAAAAARVVFALGRFAAPGAATRRPRTAKPSRRAPGQDGRGLWGHLAAPLIIIPPAPWACL